MDFEVTNEQYDRATVLTAAEKLRIGGGVAMSLLFAREVDDEDAPKNLSLSPTDRDIIAAAGDDPDAAITGGVSQTTPGQGLYVLVPADTLAGIPEHFLFDELAGDYIVSFVEVGDTSGDYRRAGISTRGAAYFEFTGAGAGSYVVGRTLPLPESSDLFTARIERAGGVFTLDGEWNLSDHDANTMSAVDDDNNQGNAGQVRMGLRREGTWRMGLTGAASYLEEKFHSFDRVRPGYYYRDWNLEGVALTGRETTAEVSADLARARAGSTRYSLARLDRDQFEGWKHELTLQSGSLADRGISLRGLRSDMVATGNQRTRDFGSVDAAYGIWRVVPSVTVGTETYRNALVAAPDSGRAYDLSRRRLSAAVAAAFCGAWKAKRATPTPSIPPTTTLSTRAPILHGGNARVSRHRIHAGRICSSFTAREENHANRRRVEHRSRASQGGKRVGGDRLRADADYEVSQNDAVTLQRSVVFVGEGKGDYNELGEAVGKGKGNFTVVFLPTDRHHAGAYGELQLAPGVETLAVARSVRAGSAAGSCAMFPSIKSFGVREESTYEPAWKFTRCFPRRCNETMRTVFGTTTLRQDWSLLDGYKNLSLTLRYLREDREDNRFEGVREKRAVGRTRGALVALAFGRADRGGGRRDGAPTSAAARACRAEPGAATTSRSGSALLGAGVVLAPGANLDVDVRLAQLADDESGAEQRYIKVTPRLVWRIAEQFNVFGTYELTEVKDQRRGADQADYLCARRNLAALEFTPNLRISHDDFNLRHLFGTQRAAYSRASACWSTNSAWRRGRTSNEATIWNSCHSLRSTARTAAVNGSRAEEAGGDAHAGHARALEPACHAHSCATTASRMHARRARCKTPTSAKGSCSSPSA